MKKREEEPERSARESMNAFGAMMHVRCPECRKGIVFRRGMEMNRLCPYCGIKFDREPGYFTGAIWISMLVAMPVMLFLMFCLIYFFRDLHPALAGILAAVGFVPLLPVTIRISRSIWMYLDHQMHPQRSGRRPPGDPGDDRSGPVPTGVGHGNGADRPERETEEAYTHRIGRRGVQTPHPVR